MEMENWVFIKQERMRDYIICDEKNQIAKVEKES